jgi:hypothetical protein
MTRPVSREAKEALALMMSGAGLSLVNADLVVGDERTDVDVVCLSVTTNGGGVQVRPLAIICDGRFLELLEPPEDWEVQDGL